MIKVNQNKGALYNQVDGRVLKLAIKEEKTPRVTLSFYRYIPFPDPENFRIELFLTWNHLGVLGRTYVAREGINAQISVPEANFEAFKNHLETIPQLQHLRLNIAVEDDGKSFFKLKIKIKEKLVADGLAEGELDLSRRGIHLKAQEFNQLGTHPESVVVDMRNHYESRIGHFEGAIRPDVDTFRESLPLVVEMLADHKDKPVLMYCTGGIRCEKASAYLIQHGFQEVYQLDGGIINYAHEIAANGIENKFRGKNFVFDERLAESISEEVLATCDQCGAPCDAYTNCQHVACNMLFIQCPECAAHFDGCCSDTCKDIFHLPEETQKAMRRGVDAGVRIFSKGRFAQRR